MPVMSGMAVHRAARHLAIIVSATKRLQAGQAQPAHAEPGFRQVMARWFRAQRLRQSRDKVVQFQRVVIGRGQCPVFPERIRHLGDNRPQDDGDGVTTFATK